MGTSLDIKAHGTDGAKLDAAIAAAIAEIQRVEDVMTDWRPSPLTTLNEVAGRGPQLVKAELAQILDRGLAIGEQTGGVFDITFAGVGKLWKFKGTDQQVPAKSAIDAALIHVGYQRVKVDRDRRTVDLPAGMRLGLGGIAKGYGVDRAMAVLRKHGVEHAIVNAGGDLKVLGHEADRPWEVAVKHPRDRERVIAALRLSNIALVTSGDYERFFEHEGRRYHHILDPRTGYPSEGAMSASVLAASSELADALATALCVIGPAEGMALVEQLPRVEAIVVGMDGELYASSGLASSIAE